MIWTFCPSCSARVEWAAVCSQCGATIPAFDAGNGQAGVPRPGDSAEACQDGPGASRRGSKSINRLTLLLICLGIIAAAVLLVRLVVSGNTDGRATGPPEAPEAIPAADNRPLSITAVSVSGITETSATVSWTTDKASSSRVEYFDLGSRACGSAVDTAMGTTHSMTIGSLSPGVTYRFSAWSTDASGNRAGPVESTFNTIHPGASGQVESGAVYFHESRVLGTDKQPIELWNNTAAADVSWDYLQQFLLEDETDRMPYVDGSFDCSEYAEILHNNAEAAGIRAAYVCLKFTGASSGHAINAFQTTDAGLVFIDCTGQPVPHSCPLDSIVDVRMGEPYTPHLIFPCPYIAGLTPLGPVADIGITW